MKLTEKMYLKAEDVVDNILTQDKMGESEIQKSFAGCSVFITGGTGFLGKLLIEKLLRSCPCIKKLYLLARPKKNKAIWERLQKQFDDPLYDTLRNKMPNFIEKIDIIEGDLIHIGLGISKEDQAKIIGEVQFIFHLAATVRFDEPLKTAVIINVRGSREMLKLAQAFTKLRAYIHVSTAYSNCPLKEIGEKFYESPIAGDKLIDFVENVNMDTINTITPGLLGEFPNTYSYTKLAAEDIVRKYSKGLPVAVIRPSIVVGTASEPVGGWTDNIYGPNGVALGALTGVLHVVNANPNSIADLVPGDMFINGCIATAWKTAKDFPANHVDALVDQLPIVYNYVSSEQAPLCWENYMEYCAMHGRNNPTIHMVWMYFFFLKSSKIMSIIYGFFFHWIPAYVIDFSLILIGKKPMLRNICKKIDKFDTVFSYFATREWKFENKNIQKLNNELCEADKQIYNFNMESLKWSEYFEVYIKGVRIYLLNDPLDTLPRAKTKLYKLELLHKFLVSLFYFLIVYLVTYLTRLFLI